MAKSTGTDDELREETLKVLLAEHLLFCSNVGSLLFFANLLAEVAFVADLFDLVELSF